MKKVLLTSMILLSTVSYGGNVYAQETSGKAPAATTPTTAKASVTFTSSVDGKTLTISGQGDLTSYMTTDFSARVFTDKAVGFVFADAAGNMPVAAGDSYNAGKTYYQAEYNYNQILDGAVPVSWENGFGEVKTVFDVDKVSTLYSGYYDYNGNIVIDAKVTANTILNNGTISYDGKTYSYYFNCEDDIQPNTTIPLTELADKKVSWLTQDELNSYLKVTYQVTGNTALFVSRNGADLKEALVAGQTYTYQSGDLFFEGAATYAQIENNDAFFGEKGAHSDFIKADETAISFKDLLARKILEGVKVVDAKKVLNDVTPIYETVKFVNEGKEPFIIDADAVCNILYPKCGMEFGANVTTKILDLGEVTINDLSSTTFVNSEATWLPQYLKLESLTLPLTKKTSVFNEDSKVQQFQDKMVVPSDILSKFQGHSTLNNVVIPEGYENIANEAFQNLNVANFKLPTTIRVIGDKAFFNCNNIANIELNEGLVNIGEQAFNMGEASALRAVKFPSTLRIIKDGAFLNCKIYDLKLNAGLEFIGNTAFGLPAEQTEKVLEIPASVKYIGPFAFNFRQYQDVYFYGAKAPLMPLGDSKYLAQCTNGTAFTALTLMGLGGFTRGNLKTDKDLFDNAEEGYANRENFKNSKAYFCILHYPKGLSDDNRATYNDITKIYKTAEEGQTFVFAKNDNPDSYVAVGQESEDLTWAPVEVPAAKNVDFGFQDTYLGRQYIWPSQAQWLRSYIVSSNGYNWNGVDKYRPELTDDEIATLKYAGYVLDSDGGTYSKDDLQKIAHLGTRQFVLANADVNEDKKEEEEPEYPISMEGGKWWTICVPFNMTKAQIDDVFGPETHVCRFNMVERLRDNQQNHYLKLYFTNDVYVHKSVKDEDGNYTKVDGVTTGDDDIVIYAHESYMIRPTKDNKDANKMYNIKNYKLEIGSPVPTQIEANKDWIKVEGSGMNPMDEDESVEDRTYRFIGNYQAEVASAKTASEQSEIATQATKSVTVPQFSFIYAKKKSYPDYQFWFYYGTQMVWSPNKCVVQAKAKDGGVSDAGQFYGLRQDTNGNWYKPNSANAKKVSEQSFFGAADETTGVDNVVIIAGDGDNSEIVYNLNGQVVNNNGNLNGLQKGVYIKNGKKYMVK